VWPQAEPIYCIGLKLIPEGSSIDVVMVFGERLSVRGWSGGPPMRMD
jgi:hypothetical protein